MYFPLVPMWLPDVKKKKKGNISGSVLGECIFFVGNFLDL